MLCWWLEREVNLPTTRTWGAEEGRCAGGRDALPVEGNTAATAFATAAAGDAAPVELKRSVPRSFGMAAKSFAKCFVAIGVLDLIMARRSKARFFMLHALVNAIVTIKSTGDMVNSMVDPMKSMEGPTNMVPAYMILTLFIYHVTMFKNAVRRVVAPHTFWGGIGGVGLHFCPGLANALCFFIMLPERITQCCLVKDRVMHPYTEKIVNGAMNAWVRGPGLTMVGFCMYLAAKYGRTRMPAWAAVFCGLLSWFNGNYYSARVIASAGSVASWRPS